LKSHKIHTVLLATDSQEAIDLFKTELPKLVANNTIQLKLNNYDRSSLEIQHRQDTTSATTTNTNTNTNHWIEHRASRDLEFAAHAMHTALEDVRLLSRGNLLVGAMCSNFAKMVYGAMIGHSGRNIPVVSVDTCDVVCDSSSNKMEFTQGSDFVHE
jgi:hypothetical protein